MNSTIWTTLSPTEAAALAAVLRHTPPQNYLPLSQLDSYYSAVEKILPQLRGIAVP